MPVADVPVEFRGLKIPLPRWAVSVLALVVIAGAGLFIWRQVYVEPERVVLSLKEVNEELARSVDEYGRHAMEEPARHELFEDADGALGIRVYRDHCVLIQRRTRDGVLTRLVRDLAREQRPQRTLEIPPLVVPLEASQPACNRGCLNPHPGAFRWWYGEQKGEWVQVWRQWPEGCLHYQLFHPKSGTWDSNPDGTPRVHWRCCTH